jgi:hypothetical protein
VRKDAITAWPRLLIGVVGLALLLPMAYVTLQEFFVLRRSDVLEAVEPLVAVPLVGISVGSFVSREVTVPSGCWWERMTRNYGEPKLLIAAVNVGSHEDGRGRRVYRPDEVDLDVAVSRGGSPVPIARTTDAPYGYSSDESSAAWVFQTSKGEVLTVTLARQASKAQLPPGEIVIVPNWPRGEIAGALDGFAFVRGIRWILIAFALSGAVLLFTAVRGIVIRL